MTGSIPRPTIPPVWAQQARCPVCGAARLSVRQTPGAPDQLACAQCGSAFELEAGGSRLALRQGPPALASAISRDNRLWLSPAEVHALLQSPAEHAPTAAEPTAGRSPTAPSTPPAKPADTPMTLAGCSKAELQQRAEALLALGNSPLQIQVALVQSGVPAERVEVVVSAIQRLAQAKRGRQVQRTWLLTGLTIACLVMATGAGVGIWYQGRGTSTAVPVGTARPPTPTGAAGFLLSLPTTVVQTEPPSVQATGTAFPPGRCPVSPGEAATLFGGQAADWTYKADVVGWIMTTITPQTIYIPAGMLAGYLQFGEGGANMNQVDGPAKLHNVNFIAITCP